MHVLTIDFSLDGLDSLDNSVEEVRKILDKESNVFGYYLMRYSDKIELGTKILVKKEDIDSVLIKIRNKIKEIRGFNKITQEKDEGIATIDNHICRIAMKTRNSIRDIFGKDISSEEYNSVLSMIIHYISNPLLKNYQEELNALTIHSEALRRSIK